jgi:FlaA1/EpsC-like NDP-sugar epimerase
MPGDSSNGAWLAGRGVDDIKIVFSGLRPGGKLFEELLEGVTIPTSILRLRIARVERD